MILGNSRSNWSFSEVLVTMVHQRPWASLVTHCNEHFAGGDIWRKGYTAWNTTDSDATSMDEEVLERQSKVYFLFVCFKLIGGLCWRGRGRYGGTGKWIGLGYMISNSQRINTELWKKGKRKINEKTVHMKQQGNMIIRKRSQFSTPKFKDTELVKISDVHFNITHKNDQWTQKDKKKWLKCWKVTWKKENKISRKLNFWKKWLDYLFLLILLKIYNISWSWFLLPNSSQIFFTSPYI